MKQNIEDKKLKELFRQLPKQPAGLKQRFDVMRAVREEAARRERRAHRLFGIAMVGVCVLAVLVFVALGSKGLFSCLDFDSLVQDRSFRNPFVGLGSDIAGAPLIFLSVVILFGLFLYELYRNTKHRDTKS